MLRNWGIRSTRCVHSMFAPIVATSPLNHSCCVGAASNNIAVLLLPRHHPHSTCSIARYINVVYSICMGFDKAQGPIMAVRPAFEQPLEAVIMHGHQRYCDEANCSAVTVCFIAIIGDDIANHDSHCPGQSGMLHVASLIILMSWTCHR